MIDFIWNMRQEGRIADAKHDAARARDDVARYQERIQELEFSRDRMALACQALWELLRARVGITDADLLAKMNEVDLRDGVKDQRMALKRITCPKCQRIMNTKTARCIYCGTTFSKPHLFQ